MITSIAKPKIQPVSMGYSTSGKCACYEHSTGNTNLYYVKTYNDNDIRCITGIFTDSSGVTPASSGYYAMQLTTSQANGNTTGFAPLSGSRYHYIYWDGVSLSSESSGTAIQAVQVTEGSTLGLFKTSSSSAITCSLTYSGYYVPSGSTFNTLLFYLWTDRFGCNTAANGYYINPRTYDRLYWNGSSMSSQSDWNPATIVPHIDLKYGNSANSAVCGAIVSAIRQHCGGSNPVIDWTYPIMDYLDTSNFAATGYYAENGAISGDQAHYWNGTVGVWGSTSYQTCATKGN